MVAVQLLIPQLIQDIIDEGILAENLSSIARTSFAMIFWSAVAGGVACLSAGCSRELRHRHDTRPGAVVGEGSAPARPR
jgi:hypothetical protein